MQSTNIKKLLFRSGGYRCKHFRVRRLENKKKKGCCGQRGDTFVAMCLLVNGVCPGLINCPRLDPATKSTTIKEWSEDVKNNKNIDVTKYLET